MGTCPTMKVLIRDREVVINVSDYDEKIHRKPGEVKSSIRPAAKPSRKFSRK